MANTLVVFYSYTGTSRQLAQLLAAQQNWPLAEIVELESRAGAAGTMRCVLDSLLRREPLIRYEGPDPAQFDAVLLVSPIWMYRLAGPMRSFIRSRAATLGPVAVVSVMGSAGAVNAVAEVASLLGRPPVQSVAFTSREVEDGSYAGRLQAFGDGLAVPQRSPAEFGAAPAP